MAFAPGKQNIAFWKTLIKTIFRRAKRDYFVSESFWERYKIPLTPVPVNLVIHFWKRFVDMLPSRVLMINT